MRAFGSNRVAALGDAIFAEMESWKNAARERGLTIINLGIGSPDQPPSQAVRARFAEEVVKDDAFRYPLSEGGLAFRSAASNWLVHRFGEHAKFDPETEITTIMGSQDGLSHLPLALGDSGDVALVPDPGYPIFAAAPALAGLEVVSIPLRPENHYLPDLEAIPADKLARAKYMVLNYPNNPLAVLAPLSFFEKWVAWGRKHGILLVHDLAYSELAFDGQKPVSIFQVPGAKDIAVEFHSLSKSFNLGGSRIAFLAGNADVIRALRVVKSNFDYGVFEPTQAAAIEALEADMRKPFAASTVYERRRDTFLAPLAEVGWKIPTPYATMFVWAPLPAQLNGKYNSRSFTKEIIQRTGVVVTPGDAFGREGEGFIRIALVQDESKLVEAANRLAQFIKEL
jgi:LL-diaminopimelate aminotransferase